MVESPRIVFMGTAEFAVPAMLALHRAFGLTAVVTLPDAPKGRGQTLQPTHVKRAAEDAGVGTILQPASLKDGQFASDVAELRPDIICVIAFRILPRAVYSLARIGAFNVHASLLPRYRGAAPINHAIMAGDDTSGVTSFLLNDVVDTGTILLQQALSIRDGWTAGELYAALMPLAADCAVATCQGLLSGSLTPAPQDESKASPAPKVFRETSAIDWSNDHRQVRNFIHGLSPSPCAWSLWQGDVVKIYRVALHDRQLPAGNVAITETEWLVGCGSGSVSILEVQLPGRKRLPIADVLRGYRGPSTGTMQ
ncbi:MAG: methionyl-tRNA formyltransferase [Candidatus Kapabacteria bacterium]|jgi:methionyl-tRNA formyltransferase|nr:methionyl-tRNA formyltransferase [Candidatus Kapabacteria bacterium]